jgi:hypothetical protein
MTAPGIDICLLVPLYVEALFEDQLLGGATGSALPPSTANRD